MKRILIGLVCLLLGEIVGSVWSADFELKSRPLIVPEMPVRAQYYFSLGTNEIVFVPEFGWTVEINAADRLILLKDIKQGAAVTMKFIRQDKEKKEPVKPEDQRQQVLKEYPNERIAEEFESNTGSGAVRLFELNRTVYGRPVLTRVGFLSMPGYEVVFGFDADPGQMKRLHSVFSSFLSSFAVQPLTPDKPK